MSSSMMADIWRYSPAKGADLLVLLTIADSADDQGRATVRIQHIAAWSRMSMSSVGRAINRLESAGSLVVAKRGEGRSPSSYVLPPSEPRNVGTGSPVAPTTVPPKRKPLPHGVNRAVWDRDGWECVRCGSHRQLTVDHILPVSRGGSDDMDNLQTLCLSCNSSKGAR